MASQALAHRRRWVGAGIVGQGLAALLVLLNPAECTAIGATEAATSPSPEIALPFRSGAGAPAAAATSNPADAVPGAVTTPIAVPVPPADPAGGALPPLPDDPSNAMVIPGTVPVERPGELLGTGFADALELFRHVFLWDDLPFEPRPLPADLLWQIPLANQREPRMYGTFFNMRGQSFIDTAIGGQFGLGRFAPQGREHEGFQLDGFAAVFSRFDGKRFLTAMDYRAGIPLTYSKGGWQAKASYEHTSTHLGDEFIAATGRKQHPLVLDELVLGLSRTFFNQLRFYGQWGYAGSDSKLVGDHRDRFDWGVSWSSYTDTGPIGRPFLAFDMDLRSYEDWVANCTFQAGWQWVTGGHSARLALQLYQGRSPYGQFYQNSEHWVAFTGAFDW